MKNFLKNNKSLTIYFLVLIIAGIAILFFYYSPTEENDENLVSENQVDIRSWTMNTSSHKITFMAPSTWQLGNGDTLKNGDFAILFNQDSRAVLPNLNVQRSVSIQTIYGQTLIADINSNPENSGTIIYVHTADNSFFFSYLTPLHDLDDGFKQIVETMDWT